MRSRFGFCLIFLATAALTFCFAVSQAFCADVGSEKVNSAEQTALKLSPVPLNLKGRDRALVAHGSYLVNVIGGCGDCHSYPKYLPKGDPFQGKPGAPVEQKLDARHFLAGGMCFGKVISSNITPNADTGDPANLNFRQFETAMRTGVTPSQSTLMRAMPWPNYHYLTDHDMRAIYAYLSAIPHAEPCNTSCPEKYEKTPECPNPPPPQ